MVFLRKIDMINALLQKYGQNQSYLSICNYYLFLLNGLVVRKMRMIRVYRFDNDLVLK